VVKSELQRVWQDEDLGHFQKMPIRITGVILVTIKTGNIEYKLDLLLLEPATLHCGEFYYLIFVRFIIQSRLYCKLSLY